MYLLGCDVGSSSIKACLLDAASGKAVASAASPDRELAIRAPRPGWAEQDPETWWEHLKTAAGRVLERAGIAARDVRAVGICYQMHGLVLVDRDLRVLRPAIIWCDGRAVETGRKAFRELGPAFCLDRLLNAPGNFTASRLRWVRENEPGIFRRVHKFMLPGDYIALRLTGEAQTTPSGLSEGILWDHREGGLADALLAHYGIPRELVPRIVPTFGAQAGVSRRAAGELGLAPGTPVAYRAGDQPNNAWSLRVLDPGEAAATAGTSGVVYGVAGGPVHDPRSRVNTFLHVNHTPEAPRCGVLLCVNGTGILNRWLRENLAGEGAGPLAYETMNQRAEDVPPGCRGLRILPYGNGAERTLEDREPGASVQGLNFNVHGREHLFRAAQEAVAFALRYGMGIMNEMGMRTERVRAGHTNLFLSPLFGRLFATVTGAAVELYDTDNAQGAARGAGVGAGIYPGAGEAFEGLDPVRTLDPDPRLVETYRELYEDWKCVLERQLAAGPGTDGGPAARGSSSGA